MAKSVGIIRKLDPLGRVVLPKELRDTMGLEEGTPMEFYVEGEAIMLKKYTPGCVLCDSMDELKEYRGKWICGQCRKKLSNL